MIRPCGRRALLRTGLVGLSVGLAGCAGGLGGESDDVPDSTAAEARTSSTRHPTRTTDPEPTTTAQSPLVVEDARVQSSFIYMTTPDSADVNAPEGTQFVFADVRLTDSAVPAPTKDAFALVADDRRFDGTTSPGKTHDSYQLSRQGSAYDPDEREVGWIAFEVPEPLDTDEVALTYESEGRTFSESLDAETVESIAEPPAEFELVGFDYPDSVERYERLEMSVTVENVGEADGVFRAVLNQTHPMYAPYPIEIDVLAGERRKWVETFRLRVPEGADTAAGFRLLTPAEEREATIDAAEETTGEA